MALLKQPPRSLSKKQIKDLNLGDTNILLTCLVISKSDPKFFNHMNENRGVFNLTLRDSVKDYLNCVIWGTEEKINELSSTISIGNVVNVENPKIIKECEGKSKQYRPECSSNKNLSVDSNQGKIVITSDLQHTQLQKLLKYPLKSTNEVLKLSDISSYSKETAGEFVDILVVVRYNRPPRERLIAKTGMTKKCRSLIVMDTTFQEMSLDIWSDHVIDRAENWRPLETVLLITDVRVCYSEYFQAITLMETSRTIFMESPIGRDAEELARYARETTLQDMELSLSDVMIDGKFVAFWQNDYIK